MKSENIITGVVVTIIKTIQWIWEKTPKGSYAKRETDFSSILIKVKPLGVW